MLQLIILIIIFALLGMSEYKVTNAYNKYINEKTGKDKTGLDIAIEMLEKNGLNNVDVRKGASSLGDNYNSKTKVITLSNQTCESNSVASIAVAAHEAGHAIQEKEGYFAYKLRKFLVPVCSVASSFVWIAIILSVIFQALDFISLALVLMLLTLILQLVTLPVEFDASKRAMEYITNSGYDEETLCGVKEMLSTAAFTYIASTLATMLNMIRILSGYRRRN